MVLSRVFIILFLVGGCGHQGPPKKGSVTPRVPVQKHTVTVAPIRLPDRIVDSVKGRTIVSPSVWNQETISFSEGMPQTLVVRAGDSVYTISRRSGVPISSIINRNGLHPPYVLKEGQKLVLVSPRIHIVQQGEDAYQIAQQHGVSPSRLLAQNNLTSVRVKSGQMIVLPAAPAPMVLETQKPSSMTVRQLRSQPLPPRSRRGFIRPVTGPVVMGFGRQGHGIYCDGINMRVPSGTRVQAADNGVVAYVGSDIKSYGNLVLVKHAGGWVTAYAHLKNISVGKGIVVKQGQTLGLSGDTGYVRSPQVHFEIRKNGKPIDPNRRW